MRIVKVIYGTLTTAAMVLGFIAAILFIIGMLSGPQNGEEWALFAMDMMTWGIILASSAVLAGLIHIYGTRTHSLDMKKRGDTEDGPAAESH